MTTEDVWNKYIHSYIIDYQGNIWSGPNAISLPITTPIHIITACNPNSFMLSNAENTVRNHLLIEKLTNLNIDYVPVIGCSPNKDWSEASFAIQGSNRIDACKLANEFDQRAIFELTDDLLMVVCVNTLAVKKSRYRIFEFHN